MQPKFLAKTLIVLLIATASLAIWLTAGSAQAEQTEILKITVGEPTLLDPITYQNTSSVIASRTGELIVFYPFGPREIRKCRVSKDAGLTWSKPMDPPPISGGAQEIGLREGGVLKLRGSRPIKDEPGWYNVTTFKMFDDFRFNSDIGKVDYEEFTAKMYMPDHVESLDVKHPGLSKGPIIQIPDGYSSAEVKPGDLLMPMYGGIKGDTTDVHRTYLAHSSDLGKTWNYHASINYEGKDPNPELPGHYVGSCEPSVVLLPNGQLLAMIRKQFAHWPGEYKPLSVCWSDDLGKTWTKATPTKPHLMCIQPTLQVLDNGVVAAEYGRPGCHVAFSLDNGHTWQDRISFSDLPEPIITGQFDMEKAGPNKLVVVGSDAEGTKVWPITVERVTVSPARVDLTGWVLARQLGPDPDPLAGAKVELSPNRYTLDSWLEDPEVLDHWKQAPKTVGSPKLSYLAIRKEDGHPTTKTDAKGDFSFKSVKLGEYVLTVEADGYAPQHRHIKVGPEAKPYEFRLKPGRKICKQVIDEQGKPVAGACVVLNNWHIHTDPQGIFHWSLEDPLPEQVSIRANKRYSAQIPGSSATKYETFEKTIPFSQLDSEQIILRLPR